MPVSNTKLSTSRTAAEKVEYADPSTDGDVETLANSNCVKTVYAAEVGEKIPPESTRDDWSKVKGLVVSKTYSICGMTYALAPRQYDQVLESENTRHSLGLSPTVIKEDGEKDATTVSNYLQWVLNEKTEGGGEEVKGHDYEPLPKKAQKVAEKGALEIGGEL